VRCGIAPAPFELRTSSRARPDTAARQGFFWWEIDVSYYVIKVLEKLGLVWDVRGVPEQVKTRDLLAEVGEKAELLRPKAAKPAEPEAILVTASLADAE
jgi:hypothetical protein